jgi:hypothetical protein
MTALLSTLGRAPRAGRDWLGFVTAAAALLVVAPAFMSDFRLSLLAKFLCFAIIAVGISLLALRLADRYVVLDAGAVVAAGSTQELGLEAAHQLLAI